MPRSLEGFRPVSTVLSTSISASSEHRGFAGYAEGQKFAQALFSRVRASLQRKKHDLSYKSTELLELHRLNIPHNP